MAKEIYITGNMSWKKKDKAVVGRLEFAFCQVLHLMIFQSRTQTLAVSYQVLSYLQNTYPKHPSPLDYQWPAYTATGVFVACRKRRLRGNCLAFFFQPQRLGLSTFHSISTPAPSFPKHVNPITNESQGEKIKIEIFAAHRK
jgi:hypothetical protein